GKAETRREVVLVRLPELANRAVFGQHDVTIGDALEDVVARSEIEVRVEAPVGVVLRTVILVTNAEVDGESWFDLPRIVEVRCPLMVAVAAAEIRRSQRRLQRTIRRDDARAGHRVGVAWELQLWESRHRE